MKIRTQLFAGIIIFTIILAVVSALVIITNWEVEQLVAQENTANAIALEVGELGYLSNDYILYREPQQAQRWDAKFSSISDHINSLLLTEPEQQAIVNNLKTNLRNTRSVFNDILASPVLSQGADTGFVQLSWSRMAVQNQGMVFDAGRLAHLLQIQADDLRQTRTLLIFALMGSFVAFLLTSYFLFYRRTLDSIANLQNGAQIIGSGNLNYTIEEKTDDEIGELSRTFNRMTSDLRGVIASKTDLEREVAARMRAEQDLIRKNEDLNALNEELTATQEELNQNLNELTKAERELRKSEERLRKFYDSGLMGVIYWNMNGAITDANDKFLGMTGYSREDLEAGRIDWAAMTPPEYRHLDENSTIELKATGVNKEPFEKEYIRKDGTRLPILIAGAMLDEARFNGVAFVLDIAERKRAQTALTKSEERLRVLYASMTEGVVVHEIIHDEAGRSSDYRILEVNPAFSEITGIPRQQAEGALASVLYGTGKPPYLDIYARVAETGVPEQFETTFDPMHKSFHISVFSPSKGRFATVFMDITARKQAEEALQESESRFRAISETSPVQISVSRISDATILFTNTAYDEGFGYGPGELVGRKAPDLYCDAADRRMIVDAIQKEGISRNMEVRVRRKDGTPFWVAVSVISIDFGGEKALLGASIDITQRKNAENELLRKNEELGELNEELASTQEELQMNYDKLAKAEHALRETSQYLENLIEYANAPIIVWDPQFRITRFNHAFEHLTGRDAQEVIGKPLDILFPGDSREESMRRILQTVSGERWEAVEIPIAHVNGDVRTVLWNSATLLREDGQPYSPLLLRGRISPKGNRQKRRSGASRSSLHKIQLRCSVYQKTTP